MNQELTQTKKSLHWLTPVLFGLVFIVIGIWILNSPQESFEKITQFIGAIILISGALQAIFTIVGRRHIPGWGFQLAGDLLELAAGIALVSDPSLLFTLITLFVSMWLIVNSIILFMKAAEARKTGKSLLTGGFFLGILLMILAIIFLWHPDLLGISLAIWTGLAFVILGLSRIILTIRLRKPGKATEEDL